MLQEIDIDLGIVRARLNRRVTQDIANRLVEASCRSIVVAAEWRNTPAPEVGALMPARLTLALRFAESPPLRVDPTGQSR